LLSHSIVHSIPNLYFSVPLFNNISHSSSFANKINSRIMAQNKENSKKISIYAEINNDLILTNFKEEFVCDLSYLQEAERS